MPRSFLLLTVYSLASACLVGCGNTDSTEDTTAPVVTRESAMKAVDPDGPLAPSIRDVEQQSEIADSVVKEAAKRECGLRLPYTNEGYSSGDLPPYVHKSYDERLGDIDNPCLLTDADLALLPERDRLALKLLHDEPALLEDGEIQHVFVCLNDPVAAELAEDNEFAWPRLVEKVVNHGKTFLPQFATVEFEVPLGTTLSLSKYDGEAGGFHILDGGRDPNIGQIGIQLPFMGGCFGNSPLNFPGNVENWFERGRYEKFIVALDRPISGLFLEMTPTQAEDFITRQIKDDLRIVSLTARVSVSDYERSPKRTGFNRVTFQGNLRGVTVNHRDIEDPLLKVSYP
ncbi:MAG: hypothetical protein ACSHX3_07865 [Litorimonas sp.]